MCITYSDKNPIDWLDFRRWCRSLEDDRRVEQVSLFALLEPADSPLFTTMRGLNNFVFSFDFAFKPHVWLTFNLSFCSGRFAAQMNGKIESRIPSLITSFNFSVRTLSNGDFSLILWRLRFHFWYKLFSLASKIVFNCVDKNKIRNVKWLKSRTALRHFEFYFI